MKHQIQVAHTRRASERIGSAVFYLLIVVAVVFSVARRPDVVLHPQFWAEDGAVWYAKAYNSEPRSLVWPVSGYLQTLPRLVALFSLLFPLAAAPLAFACFAIAIQVLPVAILISDRTCEIGSYPARYFLAFLYLALPNSHELHANITNAQWALALAALLIIFSQPAISTFGRTFEIGRAHV